MEDMDGRPRPAGPAGPHVPRTTPRRAEVGDQYATRHNPFVYFHSIIDFPTCAQNVVDLSHLRRDLDAGVDHANYSFITPNLCNDGHDSPCVDGQPGGLEPQTVAEATCR